MRVTSRPQITLLAINPAISGKRAKPLCVALIPCTTCMYSGMNITTPRNAVLITNDASAAMRNEWMRNRCSGRIGDVALVSTHRKIPSDTQPTANNPRMCGESHGYVVPPSVSPSSNVAAVSTTSTAPR